MLSAQQEEYRLEQSCPSSSGKEMESLKGSVETGCSEMLGNYLINYFPSGEGDDGDTHSDCCVGERRINSLLVGRSNMMMIGEGQCDNRTLDNNKSDIRAGDTQRAPWLPHGRDNNNAKSSSCCTNVEGIRGGKNFQDCSHDRHQQQPEDKEEDYRNSSLVLTRSELGLRRRKLVWWGSLPSSVSLLVGLMLIIASLAHSSHQQSFFSPSSEEWDGGSFRSGTYGNGYTCVNIPVNFTLCKNIGYSKMMIPNLLGHDSLQEAEFHAKSWVPLLGLQCHPDTQLFLCSLFSPICLDRPIFPCRSLCQGVQAKCEPRMLAYNYPWPSMLKCDQFPEDHDLCIRPGAANKAERDPELECPSCNQAHTCENIVDNFCRADFVFRAKYKRSKGALVEFRKERWFKPREGNRRGRELRTLSLDNKDDCCATKLRPGLAYIVMGVKRGDESVVTFAMQWNGKDKILKNAVRTFRSMDCTNPLPMSVTAAGGKSGAERNNGTSTGVGRRKRRKQGRRRDRQYGGCRVSAPARN